MFGFLKLKKKRKPLVLAVLNYFAEQVEEASLSEILETVREIQKIHDFGYSFSGRILYSGEVFSELEKLQDKGYIKKFSYKFDGYFPTKFVLLTPRGKRAAISCLNHFSSEELGLIEREVKKGVERQKSAYKLWQRPLINERISTQ